MNVTLTLTESDINGVLGALALQLSETTDPETKRARADLYDRIETEALDRIETEALGRAGADAVAQALRNLCPECETTTCHRTKKNPFCSATVYA